MRDQETLILQGFRRPLYSEGPGATETMEDHVGPVTVGDQETLTNVRIM